MTTIGPVHAGTTYLGKAEDAQSGQPKAAD